jgi:hypothetical protein
MNHEQAHAAISAATGWYKAQASQGQNGCVEVNQTIPGYVGVRDSKLGAASPVLAFTAHEFTAFLSGAREGEFDNRIQ